VHGDELFGDAVEGRVFAKLGRVSESDQEGEEVPEVVAENLTGRRDADMDISAIWNGEGNGLRGWDAMDGYVLNNMQ
jgi:hypothetical protein